MNPNTGYGNNNLLNMYQNFRTTNVPFQNNSLLSNNIRFQNAVQNNQIGNKLRTFDTMRELMIQQKIQELERNNQLDRLLDKKKVYECLINPIKVEKPNQNEIIKKSDMLEVSMEPQLKEYWKTRTNQPYKEILKKEMLEKYKIEYKRDFKDKKDLVIHKTTEADKIGLMDEFQKVQNILEKHNKELQVVYSASKENEHKKKFEYNQRFKYRLKYDPADFNDMKKDRVEYFKKQQKKLEKDKEKIDNIIESLVNAGELDEEDIKKLKEAEEEINKSNEEQHLEETLKKELGEEEYTKLLKEAEDKLNKTNNDDDDNDENGFENEEEFNKHYEEEKPKKPIIKRITVKTQEKEDKEEPKQNVNNVLELGEVETAILDKYKRRQKK
jgi:hypothetical protein